MPISVERGGRAPTRLLEPSPVSLAHLLRLVRGALPADLASGPAYVRAEAILDALPAFLSNWIHVEVPLRPGVRRLDAIVRVDVGRRHLLTSDRLAHALPSWLIDDPVWTRVQAFGRAWLDPARAIHDGIESLWLEFDLEEHAPAEHGCAPRVFVDLAATSRRGGTPTAWMRIVSEALSLVAERPLLNVTRDLLSCAMAALPPTASPLSVGIPHGDRGTRARLCVRGLADSQILSWLQAIDAASGRRTMDDLIDRDRLMATFAPARDDRDAALRIVHLDIDGASLVPRVGVELGFRRAPQWSGVIAERHVLAWLVERGLCDEARARALLAWPGCTVERLPHELWASRLVRRLNHVKVVAGPGASLDAKAYLAVYHSPLPSEGPLLDRAPRLHAAQRRA